MRTKAVFPGSFDPFTKGHLDIVERALPLFDEVIVAIGVNAEKKYMFPLEQRITWIRSIFAEYSKVSVKQYTGLTVDFCKDEDAGFLLRGLRNMGDFGFESSIAQMNKEMSGVETIFLMTSPSLSAINSSIIRDIIRNGGNPSRFLPSQINLNEK